MKSELIIKCFKLLLLYFLSLAVVNSSISVLPHDEGVARNGNNIAHCSGNRFILVTLHVIQVVEPVLYHDEELAAMSYQSSNIVANGFNLHIFFVVDAVEVVFILDV